MEKAGAARTGNYSLNNKARNDVACLCPNLHLAGGHHKLSFCHPFRDGSAAAQHLIPVV